MNSTIETTESPNELPIEVNLVVEENSLDNSLTQPTKKDKELDIDPRQTLFLDYYTNPKQKDTFGNALQSGLKAGFSYEYSKVITYQMPEWLSDFLNQRRKRILIKSEQRLEELLDSDDEKIKADIAKFNAKTLGREIYNEKNDNTTTIKVESILSDEQINELLLRRQK
jgi:hypothetical protein